MSDETKSLLQQASDLAHDMLIRRLARPLTESIPAQGERVAMPLLPDPSSKKDDLTEICQLFGHPLYVRLDWRDPEMARYELEQIQATLKDIFARREGYASWQAKVDEMKRDKQ